MSCLYVPVMPAKRGEFTALTNLKASISEKIIPVFELPANAKDDKPVEPPINRTALNAGKAWKERPAFLDFSKWRPNDRTESGIHVMEYAFGQFHSAGVRISPIVGYDRWDDPSYRRAMENIRKHYSVVPCIRLDREAINDDIHDAEYFAERIDDILTTLEVKAGECPVLVDFGNVASSSVPGIISAAELALESLRDLGFIVIAVIGGSMPTAVNAAVKEKDAEGCIPRIEMMAWKAIAKGQYGKDTIFGDYVIRNPDAAEGVIAPDANGKIRYTVANQFFIVRGHSKKLDKLRIQHKELAKKLISSPYFIDATFSWGDSEILTCGVGGKDIADPTSMIAIDSNHHITVIVSEIVELQSDKVKTN